MEDFNKKITDKLEAYQLSEQPSDEKVAAFFKVLDAQGENDTKVIPLHTPEPKSHSLVWKIAASVLILFTASFAAYRLSEVNIAIEKGVSLTVQLPDGSNVHLNADSKLSYNKLAWVFNKNVSLRGEAFFEVEKGEKFTVQSALGSTQVFGTSFNIFAREDRYTVKCFTGKVGVSSTTIAEMVLLTPGKGVSIQSGQQTGIFDFNKDDSNDWRKGKFYFENTPLKEVLATLNRQYNVEVKYSPEQGNLRYTGYYDDRDLKQALNLICKPLGLTYSIEGKIIKLNNK